jgi:hypothetical protein
MRLNTHVKDVTNFWEKQNFDLNLTNFGQVKPWQATVICAFLKARTPRLSCCKRDLRWQIGGSNKNRSLAKNAGATFRKDSPTYIELLDISKQPNYKEQDMFDEQMTCFCHD